MRAQFLLTKVAILLDLCATTQTYIYIYTTPPQEDYLLYGRPIALSLAQDREYRMEQLTSLLCWEWEAKFLPFGDIGQEWEAIYKVVSFIHHKTFQRCMQWWSTGNIFRAYVRLHTVCDDCREKYPEHSRVCHWRVLVRLGLKSSECWWKRNTKQRSNICLNGVCMWLCFCLSDCIYIWYMSIDSIQWRI